MLKIGINSSPRITTPEVTETQESQQQNVQEEIPQAQAKPVSTPNTSMRAELMFSAMSMREQLTQRLAGNDSLKSNSESLQNIGIVKRQPVFTASEADQQIGNQPTYRKLLNRQDINKNAFLPLTLNTGSGNDQVNIHMDQNGRVHVAVNGKESWSGSYEQFQHLTIDTGEGNDTVRNYVNGSKILTGTGNDTVVSMADGTQINTGSDNDTVIAHGNSNIIRTEDGIDEVILDKFTAQGHDYLKGRKSVSDNAAYNIVDTGSGNDLVFNNTIQSNIQTGEGNDQVISVDADATISTGDGEDWVESYANGAKIDTGDGDDRIKSQTWSFGSIQAVIKSGDGNDIVNVTGNTSKMDKEMGGFPLKPIVVETGEGNDTVFSYDNSMMIIDGVEVGIDKDEP
jgi:hypothetical protein